MPPITPATTIAELLAAHPGAARAFVRRGMACVGCPMARFETLEEAAASYSLDVVPFLRDIEGVRHQRAHGFRRPRLPRRAPAGRQRHMTAVIHKAGASFHDHPGPSSHRRTSYEDH